MEWICVRLSQSLHGGYNHFETMPIRELIELWQLVQDMAEYDAAHENDDD